MSVGPVLEVALWEYRRFAKLKSLITSVLIVAVLSTAFGWFFTSREDPVRAVGVRGTEHLPPGADEALSGVDLVPEDRSSEDSEQALRADEIDALLILVGPDQGELRVTRKRSWHGGFLSELEALRKAQRLADSGIDPDRLAALAAPFAVERVDVTTDRGSGPTRAGFLLVVVVVGAMMLGVFIGFGNVFVAITGEKTQRVTESILSAITAQQWVDGKILGLTAVVVVSLLSTAAGVLVYKVFDALVLGGSMSLPDGLGDPRALPWIVLLGVSGFAFWFTFLAMVAATISDPNSSNRSALMLLPVLALSVAFWGLGDPEVHWMQLLSWMPGISATVMPVRLLLGEPALWELLLSLGLTMSMVWLFRRIAGRVFGLSMLMTGKEPSLREIWRWARAPQ